MKEHLPPALRAILILGVLTGVAYPLAVTGIAQFLFPRQANGSLIERDGVVLGSSLIGQPFDDPAWFWGRPSHTPGHPYNGGASQGSNLGPTSEALRDSVEARVAAVRRYAVPDGPVPVDLLTSSASGLDPHISPAAAFYQIPRVAAARGLSDERVRDLVESHIEGRRLGFLGEPVVNVLRLNLALNELTR